MYYGFAVSYDNVSNVTFKGHVKKKGSFWVIKAELPLKSHIGHIPFNECALNSVLRWIGLIQFLQLVGHLFWV